MKLDIKALTFTAGILWGAVMLLASFRGGLWYLMPTQQP